MQQWAKAHPGLAKKVKPGQSGYKEIQAMKNEEMENQQDNKLTSDLMNSLSDAYASMYISEAPKPKTPLTAQQRANKDKPTNAITDLFTGDSPERRAARRAAAAGDKAGIEKGRRDENARAAREKAEREKQRAAAEKTRDSFSANAGNTAQDKNRKAQQDRARRDKRNEYYRNTFAATAGSKAYAIIGNSGSTVGQHQRAVATQARTTHCQP